GAPVKAGSTLTFDESAPKGGLSTDFYASEPVARGTGNSSSARQPTPIVTATRAGVGSDAFFDEVGEVVSEESPEDRERRRRLKTLSSRLQTALPGPSGEGRARRSQRVPASLR